MTTVKVERDQNDNYTVTADCEREAVDHAARYLRSALHRMSGLRGDDMHGRGGETRYDDVTGTIRQLPSKFDTLDGLPTFEVLLTGPACGCINQTRLTALQLARQMAKLDNFLMTVMVDCR